MKAVRLVSNVTRTIRDFDRKELETAIQVKTVPIPEPKNGQVLIRVERSVINPADMSTLKGTYGNKSKDERTPENDEGIPCGLEGCGTVVAYGGGLLAWRLVGKRVAFSTPGAWAEYICVDATRCMDIGDIPWELGASCFVNPLTVLAFLEIATSRGAKAIVHTAAASALGKMLIKNGKRKGIEVVCVVRSDKQVDACKNAGAQFVVNTSNSNWSEELSQICQKFECKLAFDAVSGKMAGDILHCLCEGGEVQVYGGLSEENASNVSTRDLIFKKKSISGFWMSDYVKTKNVFGLLSWSWEIVGQLHDDFRTEYQSEFPLTKIHDALLTYSKDMNSGKVLLVCRDEKEDQELNKKQKVEQE